MKKSKRSYKGKKIVGAFSDRPTTPQDFEMIEKRKGKRRPKLAGIVKTLRGENPLADIGNPAKGGYGIG